MRAGRRLLGGEEASDGGADGWAKVEMRERLRARAGIKAMRKVVGKAPEMKGSEARRSV